MDPWVPAAGTQPAADALARQAGPAQPNSVQSADDAGNGALRDLMANAAQPGRKDTPAKEGRLGAPITVTRAAANDPKPALPAALTVSQGNAQDGLPPMTMPSHGLFPMDPDGSDRGDLPRTASDGAHRAAQAAHADQSSPSVFRRDAMRQEASAIPDTQRATGIEASGPPPAARIALPPRAALEMPPGIATGPGQTTGMTGLQGEFVPASDPPGPRISGDAGMLSQRIGPGHTQTALRLPQASASATPPLRAEIAIAVPIAPDTGAMAAVESAASASATPTQGGTAPPAALGGTGTAMPQQIAQHIAASLPRPVSDMGSGTLELALDPPELGRVRISLAETGGVMTLSIVADRPETAELMRRHMDILAQEFSRAGLDAPSVRVGTGWDGSGATPDRDAALLQRGNPETGTETGPGAPHAPDPWLPPHHPTRALDLRL